MIDNSTIIHLKGKQEQQTEQIILQHPSEVPWYFAQDFQWWWTGVFVPIIIAVIVNRAIKRRNHKNADI